MALNEKDEAAGYLTLLLGARIVLQLHIMCYIYLASFQRLYRHDRIICSIHCYGVTFLILIGQMVLIQPADATSSCRANLFCRFMLMHAFLNYIIF